MYTWTPFWEIKQKEHSMSNVDISVSTKSLVNLQEPPMFKVIYLNDDRTSMEFVIESLIETFQYSPDGAVKITENIHESGAAVVAVLPYEIAEQKGMDVTISARREGFPLQIKLEPDIK
jgi:ATP-dependent Clp protease adaptor protein ClpS